MKQKTGKPMKERQSACAKEKGVCGTLCYLAESRGMAPKSASPRREAPSEISERVTRKYAASL
jgi:hypothetical protein